jgi:hypothetical protein
LERSAGWACACVNVVTCMYICIYIHIYVIQGEGMNMHTFLCEFVLEGERKEKQPKGGRE